MGICRQDAAGCIPRVDGHRLGRVVSLVDAH